MPRDFEGEEPASYRPSAFYFREALRDATTLRQAKTVGMQSIRELEMLKEWVREQGLIPPRRFILDTEAKAKGFIIPFPRDGDVL